MKRIITMQDLSCVGKCSLSVVLPTISAMGIECTVLPTAVLSAHAGFPGVQARGLDALCGEILGHWKTLDFPVDGILTGYLADPAQVETAQRLIREFGKNAVVVVDPAMADHGKLYRGTDGAMVPAMLELCRSADLAVPNLTEAALMTGLPFRETGDDGYFLELCDALHEKGLKSVMLTGAGDGIHSTGFYWSCGKDRVHFELPRENRNCHGTGDLFAAVVCGGLVRGMTAAEAGRLAAEFVLRAIRATPEDADSRYGVWFEKELFFLNEKEAKNHAYRDGLLTGAET